MSSMLTLGIGLLLLLAACWHYAWRTHDIRPLILFWSRRLCLSRGESYCQRLAIMMLLTGMLMRYMTPAMPG
ncbi:hypothetical protein [Kushneria phosphatilytica]|uniref:Uncharacterized protein n=1 Tax=Kushneria phosphatilytica TaxID=657387 RepID=A0A5C0ZXB7_9GAMM|nr:hypothetical protein [Kushneria phosphatilytica]QEL10546.1 hypothetical protein FY550_04935 [Kushneria phosphatilytica]